MGSTSDGTADVSTNGSRASGDPLGASVPDLLAAVGPRVRTSPFFDETVADGLAAVSTYNHMWLPMSYGDPYGEYERLTTAVSMWDVAAQRHVEVAGTDADRLVQSATVVDTTTVEPGHGTYAPMLDHDGVVINDPVLIRPAADAWRFSIADSDVGLWLRSLAHERRLDVQVRELPTATLAVQGPRAWAVAGDLGLPDLADATTFVHRRAELDGIDVIISRSGWSSQGGFELFLDDPTDAVELWRQVRATGRAHDIGPGAPHPMERIEHTLLSYGTDTGYDATPDELGLEDVVDLDAGGDFVGRAAVEAGRSGERHSEDGHPPRRLVGLVIDGTRIPTLSRPRRLWLDRADAGELRAASWSPRFEQNLGLALVNADVTTDASLAVDAAGERVGRVVPLPFDPSTVG